MKLTIGMLMIALLAAGIIPQTATSRGDLDRTKRPEGKPAPAVRLPEIQKTTLKNGLTVWLVEQHELPTVAINLVIQSGSDHDPEGKAGLASMTADMLDEGTTTRSALQIAEDLESIGATLTTNSSFDGSFVALTTLTKHLDRALAVFTDVVLHPAFPEKDFERIRKQRLASLIQQRDQPPAIANNAYAYILYGASHPYGTNPAGNEASLNSMTPEELRTFYHSVYLPNNATLIVVGDVTMSAIVAALETPMAGWQPGTVSPFTVPDAKAPEAMSVSLIDKPGAAQSEIRIGYPSLSRNTPDYFPLLVMNRMLGGQFTSRINLNLRERHGFTYGARSDFAFRKGIGPFTAQGGIVTEKTDSAVREFLNEINLMREKGMTGEELAYSKKGLVGSFALTFETPAQIAGRLQDIVLYRLPEDYYNSYLQKIEAVSLDDVQRVARQYLDASRMAVVIVGDLSKIRPGVEALNIGKTALCDLDGKPVK